MYKRRFFLQKPYKPGCICLLKRLFIDLWSACKFCELMLCICKCFLNISVNICLVRTTNKLMFQLARLPRCTWSYFHRKPTWALFPRLQSIISYFDWTLLDIQSENSNSLNLFLLTLSFSWPPVVAH